MGRVTRTKETLSTDKKIGIVFAPKHPATIAKVILDTRNRVRHSFDHKEATADVERPQLFGQGCGLFRRQAVATAFSVVLHVAACCLIDQPLADVALISVGVLRQLRGSSWSNRSHCLVETEFLPDIDEGRTKRGAEITDYFTQKLVHLVLVDLFGLNGSRHKTSWGLGVDERPGLAVVCLRQQRKQVKRWKGGI